jgi:predicted ATPase/transcriptional regulator with XRE-family HTH domain
VSEGARYYTFGEWVKLRRERLDLTQRQLAAITHYSPAMIKKIERDERRPSRTLAKLLATCFKIPEADQTMFIEIARGERQVDLLWQGDATSVSFLPLHTPAHVPRPTTLFIGREAELDEIAKLLAMPDCRLLTLTGPGGIGKTRLALEIAHLLLEDPQAVGNRYVIGSFPDGIYFVPLQPLTSHEFIIPALSETLRLTSYGDSDVKTQLLNYLSEKQHLLILDNFEHLLEGADLLPEILASAPAVKLLVTSRERLHLQEEWVFNIGGLDFPDEGHASTLNDYSAVRLFVQHARRAGYTPTDADMISIIRICQIVQGMPLGIELAAAWVRTLSCSAIANEIERSLDILETSARNIPLRHTTMRAVFEPTWARLSANDQMVFMKLSVFHGGFVREAAEYIAGASLKSLSSLMGKSLLHGVTNGRYDIHELLHQYAREKLTELGDGQAVLNRLSEYYLGFAERAEKELFGANQLDWIGRMGTELSNLRAAISWSREKGDFTVCLSLTSALFWFWSLHGYNLEGFEGLRDILPLPEAQTRTPVRAKTLNAAGYIHLFEGNYTEARPLLEESLAIAREVGNLRELARSGLGLGPVLEGLGEHEAATLLLHESLPLAHKLQDLFSIAWSLVSLGDVAMQRREVERAQRLYEESLDLWRRLREKSMLAYTARRLGCVMRDHREYDRSKALSLESLELNLEIGDRRADFAHGTRLLGAVEILLYELAGRLAFSDQLEYEFHIKTVRTQLDAAVFDRSWAEGQTMTMEQASALARYERTMPN